MSKYKRIQPPDIEAFQYDGDLMDGYGNYYVPDWAEKAHKEGTIYFEDGQMMVEYPGTIYGYVIVVPGYYVIKDYSPILKVMSKEAFEQKYELIPE